MTRQTLFAVLPTVLLGAGLAFAQPADLAVAQTADLTCVKLDVKSGLQTNPYTTKIFYATKTVDLTIMAYFKQKPSRDHVLELKITTPDGFLYRSMSFPIAASTRQTGQRRVPGYPDPLPEQQMFSERGLAGVNQYRIEVPFPVAGTDIVSSGLYGKWKLDAILDGARTPCTQAFTFTLKP